MDSIKVLGSWSPPSKLMRFVQRNADNSFSHTIPEDLLGDLPELPDGFFYLNSTAIAMKHRCAPPHRDDPVDSSVEQCLGMFCLVESKKNDHIHLMVEGNSIQLQENRPVLFDDSKLHCVTADKIWRGVAVQVSRDEWRRDED